MSTPPRRIAVVAAETEPAQQALKELCTRYSCVPPERADLIVSLGGDGFMLETLHRFLPTGRPIYGMHRGSVGFLMNAYSPDRLYERIAGAQPVVLHPLEMIAENAAPTRRSPSTKSRCFGRPGKRRSCGSVSTVSCGSRS